MSYVIDRRLNGKNKSTVNRQRFLRRYRDHIKKAVEEAVSRRSITDMEHGEQISIPGRDIDEPVLHHGRGGRQTTVHPGNREFTTGEKIARPQGGGGGQGAGKASNSGEGNSPHPTNLSSALVECYRHAQSLCPHIHLPVQSGSTSMLKKMRRSYTRDVYLRKIAELKMARPDVGVTTDIIVGFPGETEEDFAETMSLLDEVRYDGVYAFAYSPRPGTEAAQWPDDVPHEVKEERLQILLARQKEISYQKNLDRVGQLEAVLVEGPSRQGGGG